MGVDRRPMMVYCCDSCGHETYTKEGQSQDGYFLEVLRVTDGQQVSNDNIYACSTDCVERSILDALKRTTLPDPERLTATKELQLHDSGSTPKPTPYPRENLT